MGNSEPAGARRLRQQLADVAVAAFALLVAVAAPFLLFAMMTIGGRTLMFLAGPVNVFNSTRRLPAVSDFAASYAPSGASKIARDEPHTALPRFRIFPDRRLEVFDLPDPGESGSKASCTYSGTGKWRIYEDSGGVRLDLDIEEVTPAAPGVARRGPASLGSFHIFGQAPPYRIWYRIGDPDAGMGIEFSPERQ